MRQCNCVTALRVINRTQLTDTTKRKFWLYSNGCVCEGKYFLRFTKAGTLYKINSDSFYLVVSCGKMSRVNGGHILSQLCRGPLPIGHGLWLEPTWWALCWLRAPKRHLYALLKKFTATKEDGFIFVHLSCA